MLPVADKLAKIPYWLLVIILLGLFVVWTIINNGDYRVIIKATSKGIITTIYVSFTAYLIATLSGLVWGLMRVSTIRVLREISTVYVEIIRGIPMLVILYYIAFVGAPALVVFINWLIFPLTKTGIIGRLSVRDVGFVWRAILALTIGYSAFISEIFRAGIESVDKGQMEAALALGMSRATAMRIIILPQAIRNVLPALANEFVAIIKDSALVSALGVQDITQLGKVYSASTFRFFETYNIVAFLYLIMTVTLSIFIRGLERRLEKHKRG